ncbi:hypothetical protein BOTBODRAFT_182351 [Botryobasidium botryosum FD-172 SS1]|uniref:Uncharacterized protein n=1 Tax=Botryobasidium botryosum (strain FD-172 SS1) TaxID=930990 RepID=A0A067LRL9_BOTB1|nr:hypothetical protein BOTBODRAFT_182351 [Botryobasidium botryosum FD-172 SS1]
MLNRASAGLWAVHDVYIIQQKCDPETARPTNAYFDSTPPRARAMSPPNLRPEPFLVEDVTLPIQLTYHAPLECAHGNTFTGKSGSLIIHLASMTEIVQLMDDKAAEMTDMTQAVKDKAELEEQAGRKSALQPWNAIFLISLGLGPGPGLGLLLVVTLG